MRPILLTLVFLLSSQLDMFPSKGKVTITQSDKPRTDSAFNIWSTDCGGLKAQLWTPKEGWHMASCDELANLIANQRDVRDVFLEQRRNIADMLTYSQYASYFRVSVEDFQESQKRCRDLLKSGFAHPDILAQCRKTVAGIVPYGLLLKD